MELVEVREVRFAKGFDVGRLMSECSRNCCFGGDLSLLVSFCSVSIESKLDGVCESLNEEHPETSANHTGKAGQ